jgi:hypothetical protein
MSDARTISGEVVGLDVSGARVRLADGRRGTVPSPPEALHVGSRETFAVRQEVQGQELVLEVASGHAPEPAPHAFDREFDRLHDALVNHSPQSIEPRTQSDALGKRQMEQWMQRVDQAVVTLRKRRAKRINGKA